MRIKSTLCLFSALFFVGTLSPLNNKLEAKNSAEPEISQKLKQKNRRGFTLAPPLPVKIPSGKSPVYQSFLIPTDFKEDRWIKKARFFLKAKLAHHVAFYIMDPSYMPSKKSLDYHTKALDMVRHTEFEGSTTLSPSLGIRLPKSSPLILEIHYEPQGRAFVDTSTRVEIQFYHKRPKYELMTQYYYTPDLSIPPLQSTEVIRTLTVEETGLLWGLNLHTHLRGRAGAIYLKGPSTSMSLTGLTPKKQRIFGQDPFNPIFERFYRFKEPLKVEKGSIIECRGYFDNSRGNPLNPTPEEWVFFGWTLKDEMFNCVFKWLVPSSKREGARKRLFLRPFPN